MNRHHLYLIDDDPWKRLHVRPHDPAYGPVYDRSYSPRLGPLCVGEKDHPIGRDVVGEIDERTLRRCCPVCAERYRRLWQASWKATQERLEAETGVRLWKPHTRGLGDIVADLRVVLRVSQHELARKMGTSQAVVSMWETGKHVPSRMAWMLMRKLAAEAGERGAKILEEIPVKEG